MKIILWVVVDKGGRIYWQAGRKSWIPDRFLIDPQYKVVALKGEV
jgi:hypothetical protein